MIIDDLENILNNLLQKRIRVRLNDKILKEGKLILYTIKDFYILFVLVKDEDDPEDPKVYELPLPFAFEQQDSNVLFDYSLGIIHKGSWEKQFIINLLRNKIGKKCKFFDNTLTIESR